MASALLERGRPRVTVRLPRSGTPAIRVRQQQYNQVAALVAIAGREAMSEIQLQVWDRVKSHVDDLFISEDFQALPAGAFEDLLASHTSETGTVLWLTLRSRLFAACAVDEELQDPDVWEGLLTDGSLTKGDYLTLQQAVWDLNTDQGGIGVPLVD